MKTKKLNRGLVLGAALLAGLAGFVVFDHFNFNSNKEEIKSVVEKYINDCAEASVTENGDNREALKKIVDESWEYNKFYSTSFVFDYTTVDDLRDSIDYIDDDETKRGHLTECKADINEIKVSKAGPNLAQAEVSYAITFKGVGPAYFMGIDGMDDSVFNSVNYEDCDLEGAGDTRNIFNSLEYEGVVSYEDSATFYLEYKGGEWKLVGTDSHHPRFELSDKDGDFIDLKKYAKGDTSKSDKDSEGGNKDNKPVAVKLPDGTVMDIPEGEDLPAELKDLPAGVELIYADDKGSKDESSTDESSTDESSADDSSAQGEDSSEPESAADESSTENAGGESNE